MKRFFLIVVGLTFIVLSCNKTTTSYNATVIGEGIDCGGSFLIQFNDDVYDIPENTFDNIFYEINLPDEYKIEGMKINVDFREPENDELMMCTDLGFAYPHIYITRVEY